MIVLPWLTKTEWSLAKYKSISTLEFRNPGSQRTHEPQTLSSNCFFGKFREFEHAKGKRVGH
jgi:hypothetical protein